MSVSAFTYGTIAQAGVTGGGSGLLNLTSNAVFGGVVAPTTYLPLASSRMNNDGQAQKAGGSTAALLNYTNIPVQWWTATPVASIGDDYEVFFDTLTNEPGNSSSATWFGNGALNSWQALTTDRAWTLQKNTTSFGTITWPVLIEIREVGNPSNTTGPIQWTHVVTVDF